MSESGFDALREAYLSWPTRARTAFETGVEAARRAPGAYSSIEHIVVCGMGGSGIVGDYLSLLSRTYGGVPVTVVKGFRAPRYGGSKTLVLAVSFSGATLETIRCALEASEAGALVAAVSGPAELSEEAARRGWVHVPVPKGPAARSMFAPLFYSALGLLQGLGLVRVPPKDVEESYKAMADPRIEQLASSTASKLVSARIIVAAATSELEPVALRTCQEMSENAKMPCIPVYTPEALHNYVEGLPSLPSDSIVLSYEWGAHQSLRLHDYLVSTIEREAGCVSERIRLEERSPLAALMKATLHAGLASIHAARLRGVDPLSTPRLKKARSLTSQLL